MQRRKSREAALQALYQAELSGETIAGLAGKTLSGTLDMDESGLAKASIAYGEALFKGVVDNASIIDSLMEEYSENWTIGENGRRGQKYLEARHLRVDDKERRAV